MKKIKILTLVIAAVLLAIVNVIIFTVPVKLNLPLGNAFWTSFIFVNVGVCMAVLAVMLAFRDKNDGYINSVAILTVSYAYIVEEITAANLFVFFPKWPIRAALICQIGSFLVYLLIVLSIFLAGFIREHNNKEINEKVSFINSLELDIEKAILSNKDVSLKQALKDLKELVRYSDPMSNENAKQEEAILKDLTSQIAEKCEANEEGVLSLVEKAKMHLKIRNEICLKSK